MATLGLKEMGKFLWEGREKVLPSWLSQFSADFVWKMQRKTLYSILGVDAKPLSLKNLYQISFRLCLMNGEIIHMSSWMNCMFETDILDKASPATVGRCGMVYMDTNLLGWRPLKDSFLAELPRVSINEEHIENLDELFEWLVPPCLDIVKQSGTFINYLFLIHDS